METYLLTLISILNEMKSFSTLSVLSLLSLVLPLLFLCSLCIFLILSIVAYYQSFPSIDNDKLVALRVFFEGVKDRKYAKSNGIMFLFVRILSVFVVMALEDVVYHGKVGAFVVVQLLYAMFLVIVRPFEKVKDNIIESINQIIFFVLSIPLIHLNHENEWRDTYEETYITVLMFGPLIGGLVTLIDLSKEVIK